MNNDINDIFKQHVESHDSEVDLNELWDGVREQIYPERKKTTLYILPIYALLFSVSLLSVKMLNADYNKDALSSSMIPTLHFTDSSQPADQLTDQENASLTTETETEITTKTEIESTPTETRTQKTIIKTPTSSKTILKPTQTNYTPANNTRVNNSLKSNNSKNIVRTELKPNIAATVITKSNNADQNTTASNTTAEKITAAKVITKEIASKEIDVVKTDDVTEKTEVAQSNVTDRDEQIARAVQSQMNLIPSFDALSTISKISPFENVSFLDPQNVTLPKFVTPSKSGKYELRAFATYGKLSKSYDLTAQDTSTLLYQDNLLSSETPLDAINLQVEVKRNITDKFSVAIGINTERYTDKFEWDGSYYVDNNGENVSTIPPSSSNADLNFAGASVLERKDRELTNYNLLNFVDIPVTVHYNMNLGKLRSSVYAGTAFNVINSFSGFSLDENHIPVDINNLSNVTSKMKLSAGVELTYPLTRKLAILSRIDFSQRKVSNEIIAHKYRTFSLGAGLSYAF